MLSVYVDDFHMAGRSESIGMWEQLRKAGITLDVSTAFDGNVHLGCQQFDTPVNSQWLAEKREYIQSLHDTQQLSASGGNLLVPREVGMWDPASADRERATPKRGAKCGLFPQPPPVVM